MDEEDLADAAEAQKLQTAGSFAGLGTAGEEAVSGDGLPGLFRPAGSTMGVVLLQRMGWRQGQGIGPKIRRKAQLGEEEQGADEEQITHLFAPQNSQLIAFSRKSDRKGLGYGGQARLSETTAGRKTASDDEEREPGLLSTRRLIRQPSEKGPKRGGLGVGVLNDTGSDEDDPYEIGPRISYNRAIGPEKRSKKRVGNTGGAGGAANPLLGARPVFRSKKDVSRQTAAGFRKCHDGRLPLDGFVLSSTSVSASQDHKFPPPKVPEGWTSSRRPSVTVNEPSCYQSTTETAKASTMDPKSRAALLGEVALPGKSVFNYLSSAARSRIALASGRTDLPTALGEAPPESYRRSEADKQRDLWNLIPFLDKDPAAAALSRGVGGWMPYAEDEGKRARYRAFLEFRAGLRDVIPERARGVSVDDWAREMNEFAHAARVFKPMTGMMASRFTTSSSTSTQPTTNTIGGASAASLLTNPTDKPQDPAEAPAQVGMYGPMTRSQQHFHPTRLVCKRFNVKPPAHLLLDSGSAAAVDASSSASSSQRLEVVSRSVMDEMLQEALVKPGAPAGGAADSETTDVPVFASEAVVDVERNEALEAGRAGDALFAAVFGSDDDDGHDV